MDHHRAGARPAVLKVIAIAVLALTALAACNADAPEAPSATSQVLESNPIAPDASSEATKSDPVGAGDTEESDLVEAANAFIDALSTDQRSVTMSEFDSPLRSNWSNLPAGMLGFDRNGVRVGDLDSDQVELMHRFLKTALSADGYSTLVEVVGAEEALASSSGAGSTRWSADNYWLAFFGEPSTVNHWGWQFGGHHLAVNVTVIGGRSYLSPTFVGIEPATYDAGGYTAAPLAGEVEAGLALVNSLAGDSLAAAKIENPPREMWARRRQRRSSAPTGGGQDFRVEPIAAFNTDGRGRIMGRSVARGQRGGPSRRNQGRISIAHTSPGTATKNGDGPDLLPDTGTPAHHRVLGAGQRRRR